VRAACNIYLVEPSGEFEGRPQRHGQEVPWESDAVFRSAEPLRVAGRLDDWVGHSPERLQAMRAGLKGLKQQGAAQIED